MAQLLRIGSQMQEVRGSNPRPGGLRVNKLQASGGIGALESRASGLHSTTQGNSIRTKNTPPSRKQQERHREVELSSGPFNYIVCLLPEASAACRVCFCPQTCVCHGILPVKICLHMSMLHNMVIDVLSTRMCISDCPNNDNNTNNMTIYAVTAITLNSITT